MSTRGGVYSMSGVTCGKRRVRRRREQDKEDEEEEPGGEYERRKRCGCIDSEGTTVRVSIYKRLRCGVSAIP